MTITKIASSLLILTVIREPTCTWASSRQHVSVPSRSLSRHPDKQQQQQQQRHRHIDDDGDYGTAVFRKARKNRKRPNHPAFARGTTRTSTGGAFRNNNGLELDFDNDENDIYSDDSSCQSPMSSKSKFENLQTGTLSPQENRRRAGATTTSSDRDSTIITRGRTRKSNSNNKRLIQVPVSLTLQNDADRNHDMPSTPISTFLDTGAQVTVMTFKAAKRAGIAHLIDARYSGHACGVGGISCRVLGRIPANSVKFQMGPYNIEKTPAITVLEDKILGNDKGGAGGSQRVDMLLGLDVLEDWHAMICLRDKTLTVRNGFGSTLSGSGNGNCDDDDDNDGSIVIPFVEDDQDQDQIPNVAYLAKTSPSPSRPSFINTTTTTTTSSSFKETSSRGRRHRNKHTFGRENSNSGGLYINASELKAELDSLDAKKSPTRKEWREELRERMEGDEFQSYSQWDDDCDPNSYYTDEDDDDSYLDGCDLSGV